MWQEVKVLTQDIKTKCVRCRRGQTRVIFYWCSPTGLKGRTNWEGSTPSPLHMGKLHWAKCVEEDNRTFILTPSLVRWDKERASVSGMTVWKKSATYPPPWVWQWWCHWRFHGLQQWRPPPRCCTACSCSGWGCGRRTRLGPPRTHCLPEELQINYKNSSMKLFTNNILLGCS